MTTTSTTVDKVRLNKERLADHIEQLKQSIDLVQLIGQTVGLEPSVDGPSLGCCPFHQGATHRSLTVSAQKFYCSECDFGGSVVGWTMYTQGISIAEAVVELSNMAGIESISVIAESDLVASQQRRQRLMSDVALEWHKSLSTNDSAKGFMARRGIGSKVVDAFSMGWCATDVISSGNRARNLWACGVLLRRRGGRYVHRFAGRIVFPIRNASGCIVGFGARSVSGQSKMKYLNSRASQYFNKSSLLYGLYETLKLNPSPPRLILVEGYIDVVSLYQAGFRYVVAPLGTAISVEQVSIALRTTDHLSICFDEDVNGAGRRATEKTLRLVLGEIYPGQVVDVVGLPVGQDPDSYVKEHGAKAFRQLLRQATPIEVWLHQAILAECSSGLGGLPGRGLSPQDIGSLARVAVMAMDLMALMEAHDLKLRFKKLVEETVGVDL